MSELPTGWVRVRIQDLVSINPPRIKPDLEHHTPLVLVPMTRVAEDFRGIDVSGRRPFSSIKRGYTQFRPGDVLFAKITPCMENGKIAIVPEIQLPLGYGSTEFFVMRPRNDGISRWIAYCVARSSFRQLARENMQGAVGQRRVPKVWPEDASVPLAPLPEQHRIVAKIESLFAKLDEGIAAPGRAEANLERYRASVLKAAVERRLTGAARIHPVRPARNRFGVSWPNGGSTGRPNNSLSSRRREGSRPATGGRSTRSRSRRTSAGHRG